MMRHQILWEAICDRISCKSSQNCHAIQACFIMQRYVASKDWIRQPPKTKKLPFAYHKYNVCLFYSKNTSVVADRLEC